jgi:hypothetical protein
LKHSSAGGDPAANKTRPYNETACTGSPVVLLSGGGSIVPPPPISLQELGRFLVFLEDASEVGEPRQTPQRERVHPEVARHQTVHDRATFAFDSRRLHSTHLPLAFGKPKVRSWQAVRLTLMGYVSSGTIENLDPGDPELVYFHDLGNPAV